MGNCLRYVIKCGQVAVHNVDLTTLLAGLGSTMSSVAHMIKTGSTLKDIDQNFPQVMMMHRPKLESYLAWWKLQSHLAAMKTWSTVVPKKSPKVPPTTKETHQIVTWINQNVKQERPFKAAQLYIWGPPNSGKSSMIQLLSTRLNIFSIPTDEDYNDFYSDDCDLAVLDEFRGQRTIQWLNQFLQGSMMTIKKKGVQTIKLKNTPTIILSNYPLSEVYTHADYSPLLSRLLIVHVTSFIDIQFEDDDPPPEEEEEEQEQE